MHSIGIEMFFASVSLSTRPSVHPSILLLLPLLPLHFPITQFNLWEEKCKFVANEELQSSAAAADGASSSFSSAIRLDLENPHRILHLFFPNLLRSEIDGQFEGVEKERPS